MAEFPPANTSGQGQNALVPEELLGKFNWGAATLGFWWAMANHLTLIEGLILPGIRLGWDGNALAWKYRHWLDINEFQREQRRWSIIGLASLLPLVAIIVLFLVMLNGSVYLGLSILTHDFVTLLIIGVIAALVFHPFGPKSNAQIITETRGLPIAKDGTPISSTHTVSAKLQKQKMMHYVIYGIIIAVLLLLAFAAILSLL